MTDSSSETMAINFGRIQQKSVKNLIRMHGIETVRDFGRLTSICHKANDPLPYYAHKQTFTVATHIDKVWDTYKTIKPEDAWNGKMVSFGIQYSRRENKVTYPGDAYQCLEPGLILILNLRLLGTLMQLAVAHEIVDVDEEKKEIKICYVEKGASVGSQWISLASEENGNTLVTHHTKYRSESRFRDTKLYPMFHAKAMTEFHHNIIRKALSTT